MFLSGPLASSDSCISFASDFKQDPNDSPINQNASVPMPMPENRAVSTSSQDCFAEVDWPGGNSAVPRGILKHLSTSSSTDYLFSRLDPQSTVSLDSPTEIWIDRKQVRFSPTAGRTRVEWQDGKDLGEHSLLDIDTIAPSEAEKNSDLENTVSTTVSTCRSLLSQGPLDAQEGDLNLKNEADRQEQEAAQHQVFEGKSFT